MIERGLKLSGLDPDPPVRIAYFSRTRCKRPTMLRSPRTDELAELRGPQRPSLVTAARAQSRRQAILGARSFISRVSIGSDIEIDVPFGNPAVSLLRPVALRPCLAAGLPFSWPLIIYY